MKNSLGVFLLLVSFAVQSQTDISVDIEERKVNDLQTSSIGDSLFIAHDWFDRSEPPKLKKGYWITPSGEVKAYEFGFAQKLILCGVERANVNEHYYYVIDLSEKKKNLTSVGIFFSPDVNLKNAFMLNEVLEIAGDYLGADSSNGIITLFFFDEKANSIRCQPFKTGKAKEHFIVPLPSKLRSDVVFIDKMKQIPYLNGKSKNKIFIDSESLTLLSDESKDETVIFRANLDSKESKSFSIASDSRNSVIKDNTFLYGRFIYKLTVPRKEVELTIYDVESGSKVYEKQLSRLDAFSDIDIYHQTGFVTYKAKNLKSLLLPNLTANRFMVVEPFSASNKEPLIVFGSYIETKGATPFLLNPYNLAGSIAAGLLANAIWQTASKEYAVSKYAYLNGSPADQYRLVAEFKSPKPIRQIIDDYEITEGQPKFNYDLKMYQNTTHGTIGIYHSKKERKLRLVRF